MLGETPGVYKRVDAEDNVIGYVAVIEVAGKQRKQSARTYEAARRIKRESDTDRDRGELQEPTAVRLPALPRRMGGALSQKPLGT